MGMILIVMIDDIYDDNYDGDFDDDGCHADRAIMNHEEGFDLNKVLTAPSVMTIAMMMTLMMMMVVIIGELLFEASK